METTTKKMTAEEASDRLEIYCLLNGLPSEGWLCYSSDFTVAKLFDRIDNDLTAAVYPNGRVIVFGAPGAAI